MRIARDFDFYDLQGECWECDDLLNRISDADMEDALMDLLEEVFNADVPTLTEVNDFLRFDDEYIYETLGISSPYDNEDDEEDEDEEEEDEDDEELGD